MISVLRQKRFMAEKTIYDIQRATGIDAARLSLIERNYRNPSHAERQSLARALDCNVGDLFPEVEPLN